MSPQRWRLAPRTIGAVAIVAAIGAGVLLSRSRRPNGAAVPPTNTESTNPVSRPPERQQETAAIATPSAVNVELRVVRPVWMRVTVDGEKKREGVTAAGDELRFSADRAIVVRVGNGGDVLVKTGGRQEPFGSAGQPLTRTFSAGERRGSADR